MFRISENSERLQAKRILRAIELFNGKLHDECLNANQFLSIDYAGSKIEAWRTDYTCVDRTARWAT